MHLEKFALTLGLAVLVILFFVFLKKIRRTKDGGHRGESYRDRFVTDSIDPDGAPTNLNGEPFRPSSTRQRAWIPQEQRRPTSQGGDPDFNRALANNERFLEEHDTDRVVENHSDDSQ